MKVTIIFDFPEHDDIECSDAQYDLEILGEYLDNGEYTWWYRGVTK